jgi:UPF0755 protein
LAANFGESSFGNTGAELMKSLIVKTLVLLLVAVLATYYWLDRQVQQPINLLTPTLFEVRDGEYAHSVLNHLSEAGIIEQSLPFKILLKFKPALAELKTGIYEIEPGLNGEDVLRLLSSGKEKQFSISLVEGLRWNEWQGQLKSHPRLTHSPLFDERVQDIQGSAQGLSLEGWLLPETYYFTHGTQTSQIVQRAYAAMHAYLVQAWENRAPDLPYDNAYEALIMASIIEKETGVANERPRISGVFVNRLRQNMRLQTDPTVIYGMGDSFDGNIRRKDLRTPTAYNTYVIKGLPPTPIAMPSKLAIDAAMHPLETDELYFVAMGNGRHKFSHTLQEHNLAVREYQLKR